MSKKRNQISRRVVMLVKQHALELALNRTTVNGVARTFACAEMV